MRCARSFPLAKEEGVKHIIVQHPEYIVDASIEEQVEFAKMGAYIEHLAIFCFTHWGAYPTDENAPPISVREQAKMVKAVGPREARSSPPTWASSTTHPPGRVSAFSFSSCSKTESNPARSRRCSTRTPARVLGLPLKAPKRET